MTLKRPPLDLYPPLLSLSGVVGKEKNKAKLKPRRCQCLFLDYYYAGFATREWLAGTHTVNFYTLFNYLALCGCAEIQLMARVDF